MGVDMNNNAGFGSIQLPEDKFLQVLIRNKMAVTIIQYQMQQEHSIKWEPAKMN